MRRENRQRIITVLLSLCLTASIVHYPWSREGGGKNFELRAALTPINGWENKGVMTLEPKILENLRLDDYINEVFCSIEDCLSLYIGYYLTAKKIGAAHDPMVCFPGQGWEVSHVEKGEYVLTKGSPVAIQYSSMRASNGREEKLVVYWFQSYDRTSAGTFTQKFVSLWQKLVHQREENALVRITASVGDRSPEEAKESIFEFVESFYPRFLEYIEE